MKFYLSFLMMLIISPLVYSQYGDEYKSGMVIKMNEDGSKFTRVILWGQAWFQDFEGHNRNDGFSLKRGRVLMYSQINDRFLVLTHFGVNNVNAHNMTSAGKSDDVQLFLHEMYMQYKVVDKYLNIGAGIHNWGGISRLNGQGTINMMTLDNNRASWSTLGLSDQFANHLGVFFNGTAGKFAYRLNVSDALVKTLDGTSQTVLLPNQEKYLGKALLDKGKYSFSGYVDYQLLDKENLALPYRVGTYLGGKKIFNIGAGFFTQPNAIVKTNALAEVSSKGATHLNVDAFYDAPIGTNNAAITAYAQFQNSKMGDNYVFGDVVGNGNQFYGHFGYLIGKDNMEGTHKYRNRLQPYVAYSYRDFTALPKAAQDYRVGCNFYLDGHNAKITAEYQNSPHLPQNNRNMFTLQAMILL
jgi:hypothetical protein